MDINITDFKAVSRSSVFAKAPLTSKAMAWKMMPCFPPEEKPRAPEEWHDVGLTLCTEGFVKNEREQYGRWDSLRELITNQYDAGATDVRIDVKGNEIIIAGNGHPIVDVKVLREIFTDVKRQCKSVTDVDGNDRTMIGEKGRGRFSFVRDADSLRISSLFGDFSLKVTEKEGLETRMRSRADCPSAGCDSGTVCVMRLNEGDFDLKSIKEYLERTYMFFEGSNMRISLNGENLSMRKFKPMYEAWIVTRGEYAYRELEKAFDYQEIKDAAILPSGSRDPTQPSMVVVLDPAMAAHLREIGAFRIFKLETEMELSEKGDIDTYTPLLLSQLVPVKKMHSFEVNSEFHLAVTVNSDLPLEPSRKGLAAIENNRCNVIDPAMIERSIGVALTDSLRHFFEENYMDLGYDKYDYLRIYGLMRIDRIRLPELELEMKFHEDHATQETLMRVEEVARLSKEMPVIAFDKNDLKYNEIIDRLIQMGHLGIEMDSGADAFLGNNGIEFARAGDPLFNDLALSAGFELLDVGPMDEKEKGIVTAGSVIAEILGIEGVKMNIATFTRSDVQGAFKKPDYVTFNWANPEVAHILSMVEEYGDREEGRMAILLRLSSIAISELAHYQVAGRCDEKLEHERTITAEKELYERLTRSLSDMFISNIQRDGGDEGDD